MFDQAFKLERPKYNDIWAGALVRFFHEAPKLDTNTISSLPFAQASWLFRVSRLMDMVGVTSTICYSDTN